MPTPRQPRKKQRRSRGGGGNGGCGNSYITAGGNTMKRRADLLATDHIAPPNHPAFHVPLKRKPGSTTQHMEFQGLVHAHMARIFDSLAAVREIAGAACAHTNLDTLGRAPTDEFTSADSDSTRAFLALALDQQLDVPAADQRGPPLRDLLGIASDTESESDSDDARVNEAVASLFSLTNKSNSH